VSAFVDDSTVSVMPMFYGLFGTGIAINMMLKKRDRAEAALAPAPAADAAPALEAAVAAEAQES
jgi:hypothetical protein